MSQIMSLITVLQKLESKHIKIHQNRCVAVRNRNATCTKCVDACTSGCLALGEGELTVSPEKCIGCATCATVCPTCAIEANTPDDKQLMKSCYSALKASDNQLVIACEQLLQAADGLYDHDKVVGVPCLGRIEESLLVSLAQERAHSISLVRAKCHACAYSNGEKTAQLVSETTQSLFKAWHIDTEINIIDKLPSWTRLASEKPYDQSKRSFFEGIKGNTAKTASVVATQSINDALGVDEAAPRYEKVMDDGTLPHFIPDRRQRLLNSLVELGQPEDLLLNLRLWGHVEINSDLCSSCQMCATFCPTGALSKFIDNEGAIGIDHRPSKCVKCGCCVDICPEGALSISEEMFVVDIVNGHYDRYVMEPRKNLPGTKNAVVNTMRDLLGMDQIYER